MVLLGPQRFDATVAEATGAIGLTGRMALITAGWQEREAEDEALTEHLGCDTVNLRLHQRSERVFFNDPELRKAYRQRQHRLRRMQEFYRIRMQHLLDADRVIHTLSATPDLLAEERETSVAAMQMLDRYHMGRCEQVVAEFRRQWKPEEREAVLEEVSAISKDLADCEAVAIAGGHVASLINRLSLFSLKPLLAGRSILAWSAGAMCITDRVVLFHDSPPNGRSTPQLLCAGLGTVSGVVAFPNSDERMRLDNPTIVSQYAKRFSDAACLAFPRRSWVIWQAGVLRDGHGVKQLMSNGQVVDLEEAA
jgi:hypothetical protein